MKGTISEPLAPRSVGASARLPPPSALTVILLTGLVALGASWRNHATLVLNLDPREYTAVSDAQPDAPAMDVAIPPAWMAGPEMLPGVAPPGSGVDFICTPDGWRRVRVASLIVWGTALGSSAPAREWMPPRPCSQR